MRVLNFEMDLKRERISDMESADFKILLIIGSDYSDDFQQFLSRFCRWRLRN